MKGKMTIQFEFDHKSTEVLEVEDMQEIVGEALTRLREAGGAEVTKAEIVLNKDELAQAFIEL